jgi:CBS domain-containing protein/DNA-binding CsgD family transcriptional regulator
MLTLKEFLAAKKREIWTVSSDTTLYKTLKFMAKKNIGAVPVTEKGKLVGIFSERDLVRKVTSLKQILLSMNLPIKKLMTKKVHYLSPKNTVESCMNIMTSRRVRHLPILEKNKIIGIITIGDVVKHTIQEQKFILHKVLDSIEEGKNNLRTNIQFNLEQNVLPLLKTLAQKHPHDSYSFRLLEEQLNNISSEYYKKLISSKFNFTPAEISIIKLIKAHYREKEIAETLSISVSTVKKHKYAIRGKLGIRNKTGNIINYLNRIV